MADRQILQLISDECTRATKLHGKMNSLHEAYAIILEELDEVWDIVKLKTKDRDNSKLKTELIQVAAMCVKTIESLDL